MKYFLFLVGLLVVSQLFIKDVACDDDEEEDDDDDDDEMTTTMAPTTQQPNNAPFNPFIGFGPGVQGRQGFRPQFNTPTGPNAGGQQFPGGPNQDRQGFPQQPRFGNN